MVDSDWIVQISRLIDSGTERTFGDLERQVRAMIDADEESDRIQQVFAAIQKLFRAACRRSDTNAEIDRLFEELCQFRKVHPYEIANLYILYARTLCDRSETARALEITSDGIKLMKSIDSSESRAEQVELELLAKEITSAAG